MGTASNWRHITAGFDHACAINAADELWCWGYNERGQLGIGSQAPSSNLVQVPGLWMDVAAGDSHTCALTSSSVMRCWGHNRSGQLGSGSIAMLSTSPVDVADQGAWTSVASGFNHSCGLRSDSSLWCWGNNQHGQLDDMTVMDRNRPFRLPTFSDWTGMASGDFHMCGFRAGDQLWCWGHTNELGPEIPAPRQMGIGRQWVRYSSGYHFGCAISTSGERWCWGRNDGGQLGDGNAWGNSIWEIPPP
ncbi:MAG: RCC1 domain-containing protein [Kofleriaceae bacterium]